MNKLHHCHPMYYNSSLIFHYIFNLRDAPTKINTAVVDVCHIGATL